MCTFAVEATIAHLRAEMSGVKGQLDMANAKAELYEGQASKSERDLEKALADITSLQAKLQEAEVRAHVCVL